MPILWYCDCFRFQKSMILVYEFPDHVSPEVCTFSPLFDGCLLISLQGCSLEGQSVARESDYDTTPSHSELEETG